VDARSVTSAWSSAATLTVAGSEIAVSLAFEPGEVIKGSNSTMTATVTDGTGPYTYSYEKSNDGTNDWTSSGLTASSVTGAWPTNIAYRVRVVDSYQATSEWSEAAFLVVLQPLALVDR
jgi:hypothetical protein